MFKHLKSVSVVSQEAFTPSHGRSELFNQLSEVCQSVFDQLPKDIATYKKGDALKAAVKAMKDAAFGKRVAAIVKDQLNLTLTKVELWNVSFLNAAMGFGLNIPKNNDPAQIFFKDIPQYSLINVQQILAQMSTTQDDTGRIDPSEAVNKLITADLYFVPGWWVIGNLWPGYAVSADSIAAVIIHELGHAVSFYRDFGRLRLYNDVTSDVVTYAKTAQSRKDYTDILAVMKDIHADLKKRVDAAADNPTYKDKSFAECVAFLESIIKDMDRFVSKTSDADLVKDRTGGAVIYMSVMLFVDTAQALFGTFSYPFTEMTSTDTQLTHNERMADDFASRNGAGSALAAGLTTMDEINEKYNSIPVNGLNKIPVIRNFVSLIRFLHAASDISACAVTSSYDPPVERIRQILESSKSAIKNNALDDKARDYYVQQIKDVKEILDAYAGRDVVKARECVYRIVTSMFSIGFTPLLVLLKRTGSQYKVLQDWTDNLIRNELAYQTARIDILTR